MGNHLVSQCLRDLPRRIWGSVFRGPLWPSNDRQRKLMVIDTLLLHPQPTTVPVKALSFSRTLGLGWMATTLLLTLFGTGTLLTFAYTPTPEQAYNSIVTLQTQVWFGQLMRNLHHWSANALILVVFLHLGRVFFRGGWRQPREFNWLVGLILITLVAAVNFTGYLLPWDQLAYWAVTVASNMLNYIPVVGAAVQSLLTGGPEIGAITLQRFYSLHTNVIPASLVLLTLLHFWRARKDGYLLPRAPGEPDISKARRVPTLPHLIIRQLSVALLLLTGVLVFSMLVDAPLTGPANPEESPNPAKAPWYFLGIQELLLHFHPAVALVVIPGLVLLVLTCLPYLFTSRPGQNDGIGVWFVSLKGRRMGLLAASLAFIFTPLIVLADEYWLDFAAWFPNWPLLLSNGLLPLALLLLTTVGFYVGLKKQFAATHTETIQASFVLFLVSFVVLTIIGIWFRGPGMVLSWPDY